MPYFSDISVSKDITRLARISRYELKLLPGLKKLVFVCACIGRQQIRASSSQNSSHDSNSWDSGEISDLKKREELKRRREKRTNRSSCKFRMTFEFDEDQNCFRFCRKSVHIHNHEPKIWSSYEVNYF